MHVHILGICGTFMGGIAQIAAAMGHRVTGSDQNVYPPMSDQLRAAGIKLYEGYDTQQFSPCPDSIIIGNALSRGNPAVEYVLNNALPYTSGPQWLAQNVLQDRWVLAVAGTHGKTTTSSLLAWILEDNAMPAGFLIGGVPANFGYSARLGDIPFFVVEADEYDTAFFDKRSKFVHYHPRTLVINNLEFDHADIFVDLAAIQTQFHHLVRTVPGNGLIIYPASEPTVAQVLERGCWSETQTMGNAGDWTYQLLNPDGSAFDVQFRQQNPVTVHWDLLGLHNVHNAVVAMAAAQHAGVALELSAQSLASFKGIKRRLEVRGRINDITVYDDFAHHPTAISSTLQGLRAHVGKARIIAVLEPRSNTMRMGVHAAELPASLADADRVFVYEPAELDWSLAEVMQPIQDKCQLYSQTSALLSDVQELLQAGDHVVIMSNGGFENLHQRLLDGLQA